MGNDVNKSEQEKSAPTKQKEIDFEPFKHEENFILCNNMEEEEENQSNNKENEKNEEGKESEEDEE